jgi:hypothetical protein
MEIDSAPENSDKIVLVIYIFSFVCCLTFLEERNLNNFQNMIERKPNNIIRIPVNHTIFNCSTPVETNNTRSIVTLKGDSIVQRVDIL